MTKDGQQEFPPLASCEMLIEDRDALLFRQIHPRYLQGGEVSKQAFYPKIDSDGKLSTQDGSALTLSEAMERYTSVMGLKSVGTLTLTVGDTNDAGRRVIDDSTCLPSTPHHRSIDFRDVETRKQRERLGRELKRAALQRGPLFVVDVETPKA